VLDWLTARTPVNRPIVPRELVRRSIARIYWPTSDALRPAGALDTRPLEHAGGDHWQGLCRRSLISGSLNLRSALGIFF
jgi:hypothetical protein